MSILPDHDPTAIADAESPSVDTVIVPRTRDIGGFAVSRVLPSARRRMVGPFVFFDRFGPVELIDGRSLEIPAHPHIGLATVTYLFAGAIMHRDSLGTAQPIRPGAVNWMTAGRGIVHAERTSQAGNPPGAGLSGVQLWVALPGAREEMSPGFAHHDCAALPVMEGEGVQARVILGRAFSRRSPVATEGEPVCVDCRLEAGARLAVPAAEVDECAAYIVAGRLRVDGRDFDASRLVVFKPGAAIVVSADAPARLLLVGGARADGPRHIWWNFVSSSRDRIEAAKADWRAGRFPAVPGEVESIPLPE
ncbi:MAG TPA: pirin family protein [Vicinamibacterales bacterium]|nr:pirin family protein [Vicinamibacterales bacterium]